jgi:hypothetical protein
LTFADASAIIVSVIKRGMVNMMQWQNCVVFINEQKFNLVVEKVWDNLYYNHYNISKPKAFPAFFRLEVDWEPRWIECEKEFVLTLWKNSVHDFLNMIQKLESL